MNDFSSDHANYFNKIHSQLVYLANNCGYSEANFLADDIIPETGYLDSAAIIELIVWLETTFKIDIPNNEFTLQNFGSINNIIKYLSNHANNGGNNE